jgi:hypothetical protein
MKNRLFFHIAAILFAAALLASTASAQRLPDSVFDQQSQAFGNTLQDVPPDIISVELSPAAPAAGEPVLVRAVIRVDPDMSAFRVSRAVLRYSTDGVTYQAVDMALSPGEQDLWEARIPGQPSGTTVRAAVAGWDQVGNAAFQIPVQSAVSREALFPVLSDPRDQGIPDGLDILEMAYGADAETLYYCQTLAGPFQSFTMLGASANAMAVNNDDLRRKPHLSHNENEGPYIALAPQFGIATLVSIEDVLKGRAIKDVPGITVSARGNRVCARAPLATVIKDPALGVKVFSATVSLNPGTEELVLADCSPYAILYPGGAQYTVK